MARLSRPGTEGQMFGLYATTGRAVSFLSPLLFALFVFLFSADRAGIAGILLVLAVGLGLLLLVGRPVDRALEPTSADPAMTDAAAGLSHRGGLLPPATDDPRRVPDAR